MENDELDRLREMLANGADRRRKGSWKLLRIMAAFVTAIRVLFTRKHRN
jgi:hypothetical protein